MNLKLLHIEITICALGIAAALVLVAPAAAAPDHDWPEAPWVEAATTTAQLDWLEPRGLNIVDLVGQIPEADLTGMVLSYTPGYGIVRYAAGQRSGNTVVITTTVAPRFVVSGSWNASMFGCLGQPAKIDQLGSVSPPSTIRLLNGTQDVTREATLYYYVPAGLNKPIRNPAQSEAENLYRYAESAMLTSSFTPAGELIMPGNMGCEIMISYRNYRQLTAVFTVNSPPQVEVSVLKRQDITFRSYLGVGYMGQLQSLVNQLRAAGYCDRHERFALDIPQGADYLLVNFPPMQADAYTVFADNPRDNVNRPTGGTYRITIPPGLSVDNVNSMGLPLYGIWQDADQAGGAYLNYAKTPLELTAPEYPLAAEVSYHPCMTDGGCSASLLTQVYTTPSNMQALYLEVRRKSDSLAPYATRMVGTTWYPGRASTQIDRLAPQGDIVFDHFVHLPLVWSTYTETNGDSDTNCSAPNGCGWFTPDGQMLDYVPAP